VNIFNSILTGEILWNQLNITSKITLRKRKMQENWVVETGWQLSKTEVTGDIFLRRRRPAQGCRANDDKEISKTSSSQSSPYTNADT
jgi:hypothetical protein